MNDRSSKPCDEIDITPEMVEEGVEEFFGHELRFDAVEDIVKAIYRAMVRISPKEAEILLGQPDLVSEALDKG